MRFARYEWFRLLPALLFVLSSFFWLDGLYIHAKAQLAQYLIAESWASGQQKPWPWADTWPIARMRYGNRDTYILAGAHGSALAFGPGHVDGSSKPGSSGTTIIAGHRDTHFSFLKGVSQGELIQVQTDDGYWAGYEVSTLNIVDVTESEHLEYESELDQLILVTCYPFDALETGGPLRYVVTARLSSRPKWREVREQRELLAAFYR